MWKVGGVGEKNGAIIARPDGFDRVGLAPYSVPMLSYDSMRGRKVCFLAARVYGVN